MECCLTVAILVNVKSAPNPRLLLCFREISEDQIMGMGELPVVHDEMAISREGLNGTIVRCHDRDQVQGSHLEKI